MEDTRTNAAQRDPHSDAPPGRRRDRHRRLRRLHRDHPERLSWCRSPRCCRGALLVVMGGLVLWLARPVRRYLQGRATTSLDPLRAARTVVLAQAAALTGSAAAGWYPGQLVVVVTDLSLEANKARLLPLSASWSPAWRWPRPGWWPSAGAAWLARRGRRRQRPGRVDRTPRSGHRAQSQALWRSRVQRTQKFADTHLLLRAKRGRACPGARPPYLSTSPTTKNIEPSTATMSATRQPGSTCASTCTLLNDAERSLSRHGVFSPRETR